MLLPQREARRFLISFGSEISDAILGVVDVLETVKQKAHSLLRMVRQRATLT
jgi:hypothetical protein